jgi:hypothetical protein
MEQKSLTTLIKPLTISVLAISLGYIGFVAQPFLYAHHAQPPFVFSASFFRSFLQFPGEPAEYFANFIMQFFFAPITGAIVFALMSGLQFFLAFFLLKNISKTILIPLLALFPFIISVTLANNYNLPYSIEISVILVLAALLLTSRFANTLFRFFLITIPAGMLIYYIAGSGYFLLFSVATALLPFKLKTKERVLAALFLAVFALLLPWFAAHFVFALPPKQHYFYFFPPRAFFMDYKPSAVFIAYLVSIPVLVVIASFLNANEFRNSKKNKTKNKTVYQFVVVFILVTALSAFSHFFSFQPDEKKKAAADYYCYTNNPEKTATNAKTLKEYNFKANVNYNLAMSKTGQLTEKAFDFLQITGSDALHPDIEFQAEMSFVAADFYYNLGFITEARHWAYETLVFYPNNRRTLQLLVKIHLVTGEFTVARQYLVMLKSGFGSKKFVQEFEPVVTDTTMFANYAGLVEKRSFIPAEDELNPSIEARFKQLLAANPQNKKAFEMLMLYYLLESDAKNFVELYKNTPQYFNKVPVVYEEALLTFGQLYELPEINEFQISATTKTRFNEFEKIREQHSNSTRMARNTLYKAFGSSYFYYREFVYPNVIKPDIIDDDSDYPAI